MSAISLKTALADYGHTRPMIEGAVISERIEIDRVQVTPITTAFRNMVRELEYDVSEMALSTYLCALTHKKPITALPIFVLRRFEHDGLVYNTQSAIKSPEHLVGKKVGVRSYTYTPGVWIRGILRDTYGVDPSQVTWVLFGDEHVAEYQAPPNVISAPKGSDMITALQNQEIDAAIGIRNVESPFIQPLIPEAFAAAKSFFTQTGIYPISHTVVVSNDLLRNHSWLAEELCLLFSASKRSYLEGGDDGDEAMRQMKEVVGADLNPYGVERNRKTLEAFVRFNVEQKIIPNPLELKEIFTPDPKDI